MALLCLIINIYAQELWTSGRPDGHAPISVMADHTHGKGDWMVAYRMMSMSMKGMRSGTNDVSNSDVLTNYMMTPLNMQMTMHMFGAMYAPSDKLTLMGMTNYTNNSMEIQPRMGASFNTNSIGIGDTRVLGMYKFMDQNRQRMHAQMGVSLPTGSIAAKDVTPMSAPNKTQLPYPMQLGSGTYDLLPGITYLLEKDRTSLGAQAKGVLRLGKNSHDYAFGNQLNVVAWTAYKLTDWMSASVKARLTQTGKIRGADPAFANLMMAPTVNPNNMGGTVGTLGGGFNFLIPKGAFKDIRLAVEAELPVYQNLNGTQMKLQNMITLGAQYSW